MNITIIEPQKSVRDIWKQLWLYRELFYFLAWRDLLIRYKQTVIGVAWSILRPLLTMIVFTIVFEKIAHLPSDHAPYPLLVFCALLPWQFFSTTLTESSQSLILNENMVTKIYFPRIIIPSTSMIVSFVDFLISSALLFLLMLYYQVFPTWKIFILPVLLLLAVLTSLGFGYLISALNVKYRDFRYIIPFIVQFGLYISPVGFSSNSVPENWRFFYSLNPLVGVIDGFRWALLGHDIPIYWPGFALSVLISIGLFAFGVTFFQNTERGFADFI